LVKQLLSRGVPIQAIGLESHLDGTGSLARTGRQQFLQQLRDLGMQILITECDVDDTRLPADVATRDQDVANVYETYLRDTIIDGNVKRVIFWTPCDKGNWYDADSSHRRADGLPHRPGLWAADMGIKPSWYAAASAV
jgi:endo-1,4-beta-xylanase